MGWHHGYLRSRCDEEVIHDLLRLFSLISLILQQVKSWQERGLGRDEAFDRIEKLLRMSVDLRDRIDAEVDALGPADIDAQFASWVRDGETKPD